MINHNPKDEALKFWVEMVFITAYYPLFLILLIRDISQQKTDGVMIGLVSADYRVRGWVSSLFFISFQRGIVETRVNGVKADWIEH